MYYIKIYCIIKYKTIVDDTHHMNCKIALYLFIRRWGVYTFQNYKTLEYDTIKCDEYTSPKNGNVQRNRIIYNNLYKMN